MKVLYIQNTSYSREDFAGILWDDGYERHAIPISGVAVDIYRYTAERVDIYFNGKKTHEYYWNTTIDGYPVVSRIWRDGQKWTKRTLGESSMVRAHCDATGDKDSIAVRWDYQHGETVRNYEIKIRDGHRVYRVIEGVPYRVKMRCVGKQIKCVDANGATQYRSRMQDIREELREVNPSDVPFPTSQIPDWLIDTRGRQIFTKFNRVKEDEIKQITEW